MASAGQPIIEARGLTRLYRDSGKGIEGLDFDIFEGEKVALLGLNGAGKSTTFKCLTGLLSLDQGSVRVCGTSLAEDRLEASRSLGYLPEQAPLLPDLTPREHLLFECRVRGKKIAEHFEEVVDLCELKEVLDRPVRQLSRGYRQRVGLANSLIHEPKLLLLDEPTASLDPHQVEQFRQLIAKVSRKSAVILSTHILAEVEALCDRCLILHRGRLIESLTLPLDASDQVDVEFRKRGQETWSRERVALGGRAPQDLLASYHQKGLEVRLFAPHKPSLQEHFLKATQEATP